MLTAEFINSIEIRPRWGHTSEGEEELRKGELHSVLRTKVLYLQLAHRGSLLWQDGVVGSLKQVPWEDPELNL